MNKEIIKLSEEMRETVRQRLFDMINADLDNFVEIFSGHINSSIKDMVSREVSYYVNKQLTEDPKLKNIMEKSFYRHLNRKIIDTLVQELSKHKQIRQLMRDIIYDKMKQVFKNMQL